MISDLLDEYFNYKMLVRGLKREIWLNAYKKLNNKYNELGGDMPFRYFIVAVLLFNLCLLYTIPYIFENIVIGRKNNFSANKPNNSEESLFKGMELISDEDGINWVNVFMVMLIIVLMVHLLILNYERNHYSINGIEYTRTRDTSISTKIEQQSARYFYIKRCCYAV